MEPIEKGEIITFDDGKEYVVIDLINYNNTKYIYFARDEGDFEIMLAKEVNKNNEIVVESLQDRDEIRKIMNVLAQKYTSNNA